MKGVWMSGVDLEFCIMSSVNLRIRLSVSNEVKCNVSGYQIWVSVSGDINFVFNGSVRWKNGPVLPVRITPFLGPENAVDGIVGPWTCVLDLCFGPWACVHMCIWVTLTAKIPGFPHPKPEFRIQKFQQCVFIVWNNFIRQVYSASMGWKDRPTSSKIKAFDGKCNQIAKSYGKSQRGHDEIYSALPVASLHIFLDTPCCMHHLIWVVILETKILDLLLIVI